MRYVRTRTTRGGRINGRVFIITIIANNNITYLLFIRVFFFFSGSEWRAIIKALDFLGLLMII